jgi:hypothetical protein
MYDDDVTSAAACESRLLCLIVMKTQDCVVADWLTRSCYVKANEQCTAGCIAATAGEQPQNVKSKRADQVLLYTGHCGTAMQHTSMPAMQDQLCVPPKALLVAPGVLARALLNMSRMMQHAPSFKTCFM